MAKFNSVSLLALICLLVVFPFDQLRTSALNHLFFEKMTSFFFEKITSVEKKTTFVPPLDPLSAIHLGSLKRCHFDKIYNFGDSISDTGNLIRESESIGADSSFTRPPYGESFFRNPTGRCSNGLLMIDFLALSAGLPLLKPYKESDANFDHGVNFAVAGSTASSIEEVEVMYPITFSSLDVQLGWMNSHFNSTCNSECKQRNANSLFMVGEIGANDYSYGLSQAKSIRLLEFMVPPVIASISHAVRKVIDDYGATRVVVPGIFPIGCLPIYLTKFDFFRASATAYDNFQCVKVLNEFSRYHNDELKHEIRVLNINYPNVSIVYGDYYNAFMQVYSKASILGFDLKTVQQACCGTGGYYNFDEMKMCGAQEATVCQNPYRYISWDGVHLTQHAYSLMTQWLIRRILPKLKCPV